MDRDGTDGAEGVETRHPSGARARRRPGRALSTRRALSVVSALTFALAPACGRPPAAPPALPGEVLDLRAWKLTLPVNDAGDPAGRPAEITQPRLATFRLDPVFTVQGEGVRFRARTDGTTTPGSSYPRTELREMSPDGARLAAWSTESGSHTMVVEEAITALPATKRHVVAGQIHDGEDDVVTVRLESSRLFVDHNGVDGATLTRGYVLGTRFALRIEASGGTIRVYYNGGQSPADTLERRGGGMYFKAGVYTQSNCQREATCGPQNAGEVVIYRLRVTHA